MKWGGLAFMVIATAISSSTSARASEDDEGSPGLLGPVHLEAAGRAAVSSTGLSWPRYGWPGPGDSGGAGARAGASYLGFYGGLTYMDYASEGGEGFAAKDSPITSGSSMSHGFSYGLEGGYGLMFVRKLIVRGQVGIGDHVVSTNDTTTTCEGSAPCSTSTSHSAAHNFYFEPGLLVALSIGPMLVGIEGSVFVMPRLDDPVVGTTTFAQFRLGAELGVRL